MSIKRKESLMDKKPKTLKDYLAQRNGSDYKYGCSKGYHNLEFVQVKHSQTAFGMRCVTIHRCRDCGKEFCQ